MHQKGLEVVAGGKNLPVLLPTDNLKLRHQCLILGVMFLVVHAKPRGPTQSVAGTVKQTLG